MSPRPGNDPRAVAYETLAHVSHDDAYANLVLPKLLRRADLSPRDAAFATELAYGTSRYRGSLDRVVSHAAKREISSLDTAVANVLRLGVYQLLLTRVPVHAAVNTSVRLISRVQGRKTSGLVNAVLRRVAQRDFDGWMESLATGDRLADLAIRTAHPQWIVRLFDNALGGDDAELEALLRADNEAPSVHLCARPGLMDRQELLAQTGGTPRPYSPYGVEMASGDPAEVPAVRQGLAHVQDEGSQLVTQALAQAPLSGRDVRWLDLCAGPGGKTGVLGALAAQREAHVEAVEIAPHRAELTAKATRGLPVTVTSADGREHTADDGYDRVLVDVPCSGLGALRRRPEARWRRDEDDVLGLTELQSQLLAAALRLVRSGGVVAYVTCSPVLAETRDIVAGFGAELIDAHQALSGDIFGTGHGPAVQLWPHRHGTDAMYCALLRG